MDTQLGFSICRVCLVSKEVASLSSLFEKNGEKAEKLKIVSGIDISIDKGKYDALICDRCLIEVNCAVALRKRIRIAEFHFAKQREEFEAKNSEGKDEETAANESSRVKREASVAFELQMSETETDLDEDRFNAENYEMQENVAEDDEMKTQENVEVEDSATITSKDLQLRELRVNISPLHQIEGYKSQSTEITEKFQCPICFKVLSSNSTLRHHTEAVHEKKKRFTCSHCPKEFYYNHDLRKHIARTHTFVNDDTSNSNRPFKCEVKGCQMYFKIRCELRKHQKIHLHSRPFACSRGKTFKRKSDLKKHQKTHQATVKKN